MATAELHFFDPDEPNGSTIFECSTDDAFVKQIQLDIQRDKLGSGKVSFARKVPAGGLFNRQIVVPEALCRILVPEIDATHYLHAFWINPRQQQVISKDEQGGEGFTFAGPGPKHYLERMLLWSASFSGNDNAVDREAGTWTWPETARAGAILNRLILEDQDNPSGPFLPDLTKSFSDANDSAGVPWADDISGSQDFTLRIQDDYLKILWQIEDASGITTRIDLGEVGDPKLQLDAYQTFGRDLTDDVQFVEGLNIADDLEVEGSSYRKASHTLVKGDEGVYELAVKSGWSAGELKKVVASAYDSSNNTVLDQAGRRFLQRQDNGERQIDLRIVPGFDPGNGLYMPSPEDWGSGHFWVGDTISLTTGMGGGTVLDYSDEPQAVTGITMELVDAVRDDTPEQAARSWDLHVLLNEERSSNHTSHDLAGNRGTVAAPPSILKLCRMGTEAEGIVQRLYFSNANPPMSPAASAEWDTVSFGIVESMTTTPDSSFAAAHQSTTSAGGDADGQNICLWRALYGPLSADEAAAFAAGGVQIHGHIRARMRYGIGISESAQDGISQIGARITAGATTTIRGTALALHGLTSSAGSDKWPAQSTKVNRSFPPAAAPTDLTTAVPACVAGDYLLLELGMRNYTTVTSGGAIGNTSDSAFDLPEDETTTDPFNSWISLALTTEEATPGDLPLDTVAQGLEQVGTSTRATRCDHQHAHGLLGVSNYHSIAHLSDYVFHGSGAPTTSDDASDGFLAGSFWIDGQDVYFLVDPTPGAADWQELTGGGSGGAPSTVDYLVGTADAGLSAEIVVGTTPGGELGGTWASPTVDATHSGSPHSDYIAKAFVAAKGDIIGASANDTPAITSVGGNFSALLADSAQSSGLRWQLNKFDATTAPTVNDDSGDGYSVGSRWIDTTNDRAYVCTDASVGAAVWIQGFSEAGGAAGISGGTETTSGGFKYCAFTSSGTFTVNSAGYVDLLVVGGGGGGGAYFSGGGGGAGDVLFIPHLFLQAGTYSVTVGAGGAGGTATTSAGIATGYGNPGGVSKFGTRIFAVGGGPGLPEESDYLNSASSTTNAKMMGGASSGGGGGRNDTVPGQMVGGGNIGGEARTGGTAGTGAGGGGGGAGAAGSKGTTGNVGGAGGNGVTISEFSAFGASGVFGGGGGGGGVTTGGAGGTGGGGHGGGTSANTGLTAATANTGGGGGGGGNTSTTGAVGSAGGSGVVLVRAAV